MKATISSSDHIMLKAEHLRKSYGKKVILDDVSFTVTNGECVGILGANGCGKSTLLSLLAGVQAPNSGRITLNDNDLTQQKNLRAQFMGYVPQENPLIPELTARDNLSLWYCNSKLNITDELSKGTLANLGIPDFLNIPVSKMSGGMKKRLSIGCAIANDPSILIMDEPSAALDLVCKETIRNYMKNFIKKGGSLILTTHEEAELQLCTKIYIIKNGALIEKPAGLTPKELIAAF